MPRLEWDKVGERFYEAGVDQGVLYVAGEPATAWTGLISVDENPKGGEAKEYYVDGVKYLILASTEEFQATITAYTYPDVFAVCDGTAQVRPGLFLTQQRRRPFSFSYRTKVGNDTEGLAKGYKIHLVYNAVASPSPRSNATQNAETEPTNFSWSIVTRPPVAVDHMPTAHIVIDSRYTHPTALVAVEDILYGSDIEIARMPTYEELLVTFDAYGDFVVTDNGDGTFTVDAPTTALELLPDGEFRITSDAAEFVDEDETIYTLTSP